MSILGAVSICYGERCSLERSPPMSDRPTHARRRERGRSAAPTVASHLPRLANPWPPVEIFTGEQVERLVDAAYRILEEMGLEIRSPAARAVLEKNGALVDEATGIVRLGRDIVQDFTGRAPEGFVLHARNPERDLH